MGSANGMNNGADRSSLALNLLTHGAADLSPASSSLGLV
jgi:hypothetical protein